MASSYKSASALRQIFEGDSLSSRFNAVKDASGQIASRLAGSVQSAAGKAKGRISSVRHEPLTLEQKIKALILKINSGELKPRFGMSKESLIEAIKHEVKKPEYEGLSVTKMEEKLKTPEIGLLKLDVKAPAAVMKPKLRALFAPAM